MNIIRYIKNQWVSIVVAVFEILFLVSFLKVLGVQTYSIFFLVLVIVVGRLISFSYYYIRKHSYYNNVLRTLEELDKKFLLSELIEDSSTYECSILYEVIKECNKSMNDEISIYKHEMNDYHDYIEMWIHEVKTPIACLRLILQNNKNKLTDSIDEEVDKVEYYLEQALYYARSSIVEKDYIIKELGLHQLVNGCIRKNSKRFISHKIKVHLSNLDVIVSADQKWLDYVINQVIDNAIKYSREQGEISFYAKNQNGTIVLYIQDNGVGIAANDLPRVMEKGYTGDTGRQFAKSTGIGLYLCNVLCQSMGLSFEIGSVYKKETIVAIGFPNNQMYKDVL